MTETLTLQIYTNDQWMDAADLEFADPQRGHGGACTLNYQVSYLINYYNERAETAVGFCWPVEAFGCSSETWLRFIDDIMPSGSSREYWVNKLGIAEQSVAKQDFELLKQGTIAPIGNVRIKEAVPKKVTHNIEVSFGIDQVVDRNIDFIEYAQEHGAASGGATGAGGAAPKMLLRCSDKGKVWIDTFQDAPDNLDTHYLVKFPRGRKDIDKDILRAEYHYYHELERMGYDTIATVGMHLIEGAQMPSLWLPRFDVYIEDERIKHCGMESVYSVLDEPPARPLLHGDVLERIINKMRYKEYFGDTRTLLDKDDGVAEFVTEWVRRDFLNIVFGNSDNQGRNTSFIKRNNRVTLAPIYDFAPMKADPEVVSRTFTWGHDMERGGNYNYPLIAHHLRQWLEPGTLLMALRQAAQQLLGLQVRLEKCGVPESITGYDSIGLAYLDEKFKKWGLL
jgi:serine/threonine-protein kinase HipA